MSNENTISNGKEPIISNTSTGRTNIDKKATYIHKYIHTYVYTKNFVIDDLVNSSVKLTSLKVPEKLWQVAKIIAQIRNEKLSQILRAKLAEYVEENLDLLNLQVTTVCKEIKINRNGRMNLSLRRVETDDDGLPVVSAINNDNGWIATCPICHHVIGYLTRPDPRNIEVCPKCRSQFHVKPEEG